MTDGITEARREPSPKTVVRSLEKLLDETTRLVREKITARDAFEREIEILNASLSLIDDKLNDLDPIPSTAPISRSTRNRFETVEG